MARVTVEDCIDKITNRFELVMIAAQRARKISSGAAITVERDNDKPPVIALREIAAETTDIAELKEELTRSHQRIMAYDDDEESIDLMDGEREWNAIAANQAEEAGLYAREEIDDEDDEDDDDLSTDDGAPPSLEDLAGASRS